MNIIEEQIQAEMERNIQAEIHAHQSIVNACDTATPEQIRAAQRVLELGEELKRLRESE